MEQNSKIRLFDLVGGDTAFGIEDGRRDFIKLQNAIDEHPNCDIFEISLDGIKRTDASYPRESVIQLTKSLRGEKAFYLTGFCRRDLQDNWDYAATAKDQNILVYSDNSYEVLGKDIGPKANELLNYIITNNDVTTSKIVEDFKVSAQNASARLKKLASLGLVLSSKQTAETGGYEFVYTAIK
ncbi:MAG: MarR family transcriptional regulator [Flavobacteriaceae bacterium]|nr:MarR family transcriptional regulator [Flavobacteriaceae bacterium]